MRVDAEHGATEGKFDLAKRAKAANLDAIHDTVHEMARDEARHGKAFGKIIKEILRIRRIDLGGMSFHTSFFFFAIFHAIMKIRLKKQVKAYDFRRESKDYG